MLMADDGANLCQSEMFSSEEDKYNENLYFDVGELFDMLDENPGSAQRRLEEQPLNGVTQGSQNVVVPFSSSSGAISPFNSETSVSRTGISNGFSDLLGISNGFSDLLGMSNGFYDPAAVSNGFCGPPTISNAFCGPTTISNGFSDYIENSNCVKLEASLKLDSPVHSFCGSLGEWMPIQDPCQFYLDKETISCPDPFIGGALDCKGIQNERPYLNEAFSFAMGDFNDSTTKKDASSFDCPNVATGSQVTCFGGDYFAEDVSKKQFLREVACNASGVPDMNEISMMKGNFSMSYVTSTAHKFLPPARQFTPRNLAFEAAYGSDGDMAAERDDDVKVPNGDPCTGGVSPASGTNLSCSDHWVSNLVQNAQVFTEEEKYVVHESKRPRLGLHNYGGSSTGMSISASSECLQNEQSVESSRVLSCSITKEQVSNLEFERCWKANNISKVDVPSGGSNISSQKIEKNSLAQKDYCDDDDDVDLCILEDISAPACHTISSTDCKSVVTSQPTKICDSFSSTIVGTMITRPKTKDEHSIFQAALQDLCQPRSEDTPPEGVLAVPLLRHQRIALSWMVKKEKDISRCSGGILADDQGLGKTISTIALILKERPPTSIESTTTNEPETLNLDEDDGVSDIGKLDVSASCQVTGSIHRDKIPVQARHKPAAGTLIVCPTSVLRQWSEELQNKVNSEAGLSVLVYHGTNRTKDPFELAKFDVVLTTYSIVSLEVPKQPLVDEDDDDMKGASGSPMKVLALKKRKFPPSDRKKSLKGHKDLGDKLVVSISRPLASVRWFRVVLDEAQSIKNHRTQVARACWGLRAKRRWCLSGTPIQNAVDDLYSYFRFLRYDPYSKYQSFCSALKGPIHRSPANGYKKLQAVLKTIMLRRTKGTLLDGEPIICLPPKNIEMKQVDFTEEERNFYSRLEADSRAQFAEYAAAGTVKQNYVNILLMLLRLRQACDHPLLVRSSSSNSMHRSSMDMVKKLPREKKLKLLNCLEDSLAICGICSDPPEEAVVTSCGHVFCNQCVCDHVTGEDIHCPTAKCKATLSMSRIFSLAMLRSCLSDQSSVENNSDCSHFKPPAETQAHYSCDGAYESSKIKAALQVLQSLTKQGGGRSCLRSVEEKPFVAENMRHNLSSESCENKQSCETTEADKVFGDLAPAVGEKAIVFSQWTRMLDLLEASLKNSSIQYRRLDGTMSVVARDKAVKDFNSLPEVSVLIMSLKAASLGLNLVTASHVLLLDLWWNPTTEDQAIDRAHRIGQNRPVTVLRLTVKNTVEDRILALQQKKRKMVASAFGEDEKGCSRTRLTEDDLQYLFADG